ncbi:MAG: helix-turn-helix domain-containing protein [Thermodesulfovibrionales bacterium]
MKAELEHQDIEAIALKVVELLKPLISGNGKQEAENTIFTPETLAEYLQVDTSWVYKQVSLKTIPYFKSGKYTRFKKPVIDKWIETQTVKPIPPLRALRNSRVST